MNSTQKSSELIRHREILQATLDYMLESQGRILIIDNENLIGDYYQQQKIIVEKYFRSRRLDRLQQKLASLTARFKSRVDLNYGPYIKDKTGHDINIFEDVKQTVEQIMRQDNITDEEQSNDISFLLDFYKTTSTGDQKVIERLKVMLLDYHERTKNSKKNTKVYHEIIKKTMEDGVEVEVVRTSNQPKPKYFHEQEEFSPNRKLRFRVIQISSGKSDSTYLEIVFEIVNPIVYHLTGIHPEVKAWWKNDKTIVVETKKENIGNIKHRLAQSFDECIQIEYIDV